MLSAFAVALFGCVGSTSLDGSGGRDGGDEPIEDASTDDAAAEGGEGGEDAGTDASPEASTDDAASDDGAIADAESFTPDSCEALTATVRDFRDTHPDFENPDILQDSIARRGALLGIVEPELGDDAKPVYDGSTGTQTTDADAFDQWYNDAPGVNMAAEIEIPLVEESAGVFVYDNPAFFPIDDMGFGNEGREHNFHFTTEIHTGFVYRGGEQFVFRGDDDLWMFIDGQLAIDLGGLHEALEGTVDFDAIADEFGLEVGQRYAMDIFHAERQTVASNFRIQTSIDCFVPLL